MTEPPDRDPGDDLGFSLPRPAVLGRTRAIAVVVGIVVVAAAAFVIGYLPRRQAQTELTTNVQETEHARPRVETIAPRPITTDRTMQLTGNVQALEATIIYSRADGYVRRWLVDIGDKVTEGQLLAEIDTPEVDKQLLQARAQAAQAEAAVAQGKANRTFSKASLERYEQLSAQKLVAVSDVDQRKAQALGDEANVSALEANVAALRANIERLQQLRAFAKIVAPFAGTITARMIDRGALVTGTTQLYKLSANDPVRVFIQVPQDVAPSVRPDLPAKVTVREYPTRPFDGKVTRAAGELDPSLRTMNTEVRVPNPKGELLPGMYAQVTLTLPSPRTLYEVPATAIYNDAKGVRVATVDASGKIVFAPVVIDRDTGAAIEVSTGLTGGERVIKLASASLAEGMQVEVVAAK